MIALKYQSNNLRPRLLFVSLFLGIFLFLAACPARAEDPADSDSDGYNDAAELAAGYSPFNSQPVKLAKSDVDGDGLNDGLEIAFKTDPFKADTDGDGYSDLVEIEARHNPLSADKKLLETKIVISLSAQKMSYYIGGQKWKEFPVSTGKASTPTPLGDFKISSRTIKAWSKAYGLWMPFWLGLDRGGIGIHELPFWPNGYREGQDHLGKPVSHGCIRLGIGPAKYIYDHADVGTSVQVVR